jgi:hypothetical protein
MLNGSTKYEGEWSECEWQSIALTPLLHDLLALDDMPRKFAHLGMTSGCGYGGITIFKCIVNWPER